MNSAQLAAIQKRLNANKPKREAPQAQGDEQAPKLAVQGGFRTGKRKRGTSLLKRKPKQQAHAITYRVIDEHGETVTTVRTLNYKRK